MLQDLFTDDLLGDPQNIEPIEDEPRYEDDNNSDTREDEDGDTNEDAVTPIQTEPTGEAVEPKKKRTVQRPQPKLDPERLKGPRGIAVLEDVFKDFKFCGKNNEKEDLNQVMKHLEHWAHRLFPRFQFDDCLNKIETLGNKKPVMTYVKKIRMGMVTAEDALILPDEDEAISDVDTGPPIDAFDALISQQLSQIPSSPPPVAAKPSVVLSSEQRERMLQNRLLAEEKKLARLKTQHEREMSSNQASSLSVSTATAASGDKEQSLSYLGSSEAVQNRTTDTPITTSEIQNEERDSNQMSLGICTNNENQSSYVEHHESMGDITEDDEITGPLISHEGRAVDNQTSNSSLIPVISGDDMEQSSLCTGHLEVMEDIKAYNEPDSLVADMNIDYTDNPKISTNLSNFASSLKMKDMSSEIDNCVLEVASPNV